MLAGIIFANFFSDIFAGINFRKLGFIEDFAGINFREREGVSPKEHFLRP